MNTSAGTKEADSENNETPDTEQSPPKSNDEPENASSAEDGSAISEVGHMHQQLAEYVGDDEAALDALDELARRAEEGAAVQSELKEAQDKLVRKAASLQNFRRRAREEQARSAERAKADVLRRVLDVLDDFDRSLEAAEQVEEDDEPNYENAHRSLKEGVEMVYDKFHGVLREMDVEPIEAVGQPFDEKLHEAMMRQPAPDDAEPGEVLHEVRKGYRMGDRVLRHSRVVVAGAREREEGASG